MPVVVLLCCSYMEDRYVVQPSLPDFPDCGLYAVLDGHGGESGAELAMNALLECFATAAAAVPFVPATAAPVTPLERDATVAASPSDADAVEGEAAGAAAAVSPSRRSRGGSVHSAVGQPADGASQEEGKGAEGAPSDAPAAPEDDASDGVSPRDGYLEKVLARAVVLVEQKLVATMVQVDKDSEGYVPWRCVCVCVCVSTTVAHLLCPRQDGNKTC